MQKIKYYTDRFFELCAYVLVPVLCMAIFALSAAFAALCTIGKYAIAYHLLKSLMR